MPKTIQSPLQIPFAGSRGVIKDLSVHEMPDGVWTDASNVRFLDGFAHQFSQFEQVYGTPSVVPYHLLPLSIGSEKHWIYAGEEKIYDVYLSAGGVVHTDLSGATYNGAINQWTGTLLSGIPILNNGVDDPQQWDLNLANNFADLSNWPASTSCAVIRAYKQFLIALNITKSGVNYPYLVKWSHPADAGTVPASWDETDADYDAGEYDISEGRGFLIDGAQLRNSFMLYKEDSIWRMDLINGPYIFSFNQVLGTSGALNKNCIVEIDGIHFVLTGSDVIVHDGHTPQSILDKKARRYLFKDMSADARDYAFVYKNYYFNEVCVAYPTPGNTSCNKALVWNYRDGTVSFRDLPNLYHASYGSFIYDPSETWNNDTDPWDSDVTTWDSNDNPVPGRVRVISASADTKLYLSDSTAALSGEAPSSYLERKGMNFGAPELFKLIKHIRLRFKGDAGTLKIKVGGHDTDPYNDPTYDEERIFTIKDSVDVDFLVERRYVAIRIENVSSFQWRLDSIDIDFSYTSRW